MAAGRIETGRESEAARAAETLRNTIATEPAFSAVRQVAPQDYDPIRNGNTSAGSFALPGNPTLIKAPVSKTLLYKAQQTGSSLPFLMYIVPEGGVGYETTYVQREPSPYEADVIAQAASAYHAAELKLSRRYKELFGDTVSPPPPVLSGMPGKIVDRYKQMLAEVLEKQKKLDRDHPPAVVEQALPPAATTPSQGAAASPRGTSPEHKIPFVIDQTRGQLEQGEAYVTFFFLKGPLKRELSGVPDHPSVRAQKLGEIADLMQKIFDKTGKWPALDPLEEVWHARLRLINQEQIAQAKPAASAVTERTTAESELDIAAQGEIPGGSFKLLRTPVSMFYTLHISNKTLPPAYRELYLGFAALNVPPEQIEAAMQNTASRIMKLMNNGAIRKGEITIRDGANGSKWIDLHGAWNNPSFTRLRERLDFLDYEGKEQPAKPAAAALVPTAQGHSLAFPATYSIHRDADGWGTVTLTAEYADRTKPAMVKTYRVIELPKDAAGLESWGQGLADLAGILTGADVPMPTPKEGEKISDLISRMSLIKQREVTINFAGKPVRRTTTEDPSATLAAVHEKMDWPKDERPTESTGTIGGECDGGHFALEVQDAIARNYNLRIQSSEFPAEHPVIYVAFDKFDGTQEDVKNIANAVVRMVKDGEQTKTFGSIRFYQSLDNKTFVAFSTTGVMRLRDYRQVRGWLENAQRLKVGQIPPVQLDSNQRAQTMRWLDAMQDDVEVTSPGRHLMYLRLRSLALDFSYYPDSADVKFQLGADKFDIHAATLMNEKMAGLIVKYVHFLHAHKVEIPADFGNQTSQALLWILHDKVVAANGGHELGVTAEAPPATDTRHWGILSNGAPRLSLSGGSSGSNSGHYTITLDPKDGTKFILTFTALNEQRQVIQLGSIRVSGVPIGDGQHIVRTMAMGENFANAAYKIHEVGGELPAEANDKDAAAALEIVKTAENHLWHEAQRAREQQRNAEFSVLSGEGINYIGSYLDLGNVARKFAVVGKDGPPKSFRIAIKVLNPQGQEVLVYAPANDVINTGTRLQPKLTAVAPNDANTAATVEWLARAVRAGIPITQRDGKTYIGEQGFAPDTPGNLVRNALREAVQPAKPAPAQPAQARPTAEKPATAKAVDDAFDVTLPDGEKVSVSGLNVDSFRRGSSNVTYYHMVGEVRRANGQIIKLDFPANAPRGGRLRSPDEGELRNQIISAIKAGVLTFQDYSRNPQTSSLVVVDQLFNATEQANEQAKAQRKANLPRLNEGEEIWVEGRMPKSNTKAWLELVFHEAGDGKPNRLEGSFYPDNHGARVIIGDVLVSVPANGENGKPTKKEAQEFANTIEWVLSTGHIIPANFFKPDVKINDAIRMLNALGRTVILEPITLDNRQREQSIQRGVKIRKDDLEVTDRHGSGITFAKIRSTQLKFSFLSSGILDIDSLNIHIKVNGTLNDGTAGALAKYAAFLQSKQVDIPDLRNLTPEAAEHTLHKMVLQKNGGSELAALALHHFDVAQNDPHPGNIPGKPYTAQRLQA